MNFEQQTLILFLKSAITQEKYLWPTGTKINEVYQLLKHHNLLSMGYLGAAKCGLDKKHPVMQQLFRDYCASLMISERQMEAVGKLCDAFEENHISYMPVKGCIMKPLYPAPELRTMGDADILIHMEQYDRIREVMLSLGYSEGEQADHCFVWNSKALEVELHRRLIPSTDPEYFAYYGDGWSKAAYAEGCHHYMRTEDAFIFLLTHFVKHFRGSGIGLRHVIDLWVYMRKYPDMDQAYLRQELEKLRLWEFYNNICRLIDGLFHDGPMDPCSEDLFCYILNCGVWGNAENQLMSDGVRKTGSTHSGVIGRTRWMLSKIFPPYSTMKRYFPIVVKWPVLYPFSWVARWVVVIFVRPGNIKDRMKDYSNLTDENISEHQRLLREFGLHF